MKAPVAQRRIVALVHDEGGLPGSVPEETGVQIFFFDDDPPPNTQQWELDRMAARILTKIWLDVEFRAVASTLRHIGIVIEHGSAMKEVAIKAAMKRAGVEA